MVHPATSRAVRTAITALGVPLDIGFVFPPKPGDERGYGQWANRDLTATEIMDLLPRAAAANARGGNIYVRLAPSVKDGHPGIVMIDDLEAATVEQLSREGLEPFLTVETSPGNHQAWIRLISTGTVPYSIVGLVARHLARDYGGDERAVSPRQPGRLPGFTNRKPKHQQDDGRFPFVKLVQAEPGRVASAGCALLTRLSTLDTAGAAAGAAPETPLIAAGRIADVNPVLMAKLDAIYGKQKARIQFEHYAGRRPAHAASASEVDFATARAALQAGVSAADIAAWLSARRDEKDPAYPMRTVVAATRLVSREVTPDTSSHRPI